MIRGDRYNDEDAKVTKLLLSMTKTRLHCVVRRQFSVLVESLMCVDCAHGNGSITLGDLIR